METGAEVIDEAELEKLRQFDLDWRFGPCTGNKPTPVPRRAACVCFAVQILLQC